MAGQVLTSRVSQTNKTSWQNKALGAATQIGHGFAIANGIREALPIISGAARAVEPAYNNDGAVTAAAQPYGPQVPTPPSSGKRKHEALVALYASYEAEGLGEASASASATSAARSTLSLAPSKPVGFGTLSTF